jgi:DNA-binding transcriptional regulator YiaG
LRAKNRLKSNKSKHILVNESQSQLSSVKNLKNESNRDLSKDRILAASDRNDHTMSNKHVKNLREHIALKLYENNVPTNSHSKSRRELRYVY